MKTKGVGKLDSFEHIRWYSSTKADKYSSCYLFLSLSEQVVYFHETDYCINLSHYLQLLVEVLQNRCTQSRGNHTVSESLFNQPVVGYFFNKRLQHRRFLVDIAKLSRAPLLQEHLETPDFVFMEDICNYKIIKFNVN